MPNRINTFMVLRVNSRIVWKEKKTLDTVE